MRRALAIAAVVAACAALVAVVLIRLERPPAGPVEPVWDRQACAHCRMHLGERGFAAQLQTAAGEVLFFDDPGCLFRWRAENPGAAGAAWFHHRSRDLWLPEAEARFVPAESSPMGWGFAAVEAGVAGARTAREAFPDAARTEETGRGGDREAE